MDQVQALRQIKAKTCQMRKSGESAWTSRLNLAIPLQWTKKLRAEKMTEAGSWSPRNRMNGHFPWNCGIFQSLAIKAFVVMCMHLYLHSSRQFHLIMFSKAPISRFLNLISSTMWSVMLSSIPFLYNKTSERLKTEKGQIKSVSDARGELEDKGEIHSMMANESLKILSLIEQRAVNDESRNVYTFYREDLQSASRKCIRQWHLLFWQLCFKHEPMQLW